ncbi:hypothetical protein A2631_04950 [Candidatus Daviesbacteria bacterium RIFCSPHIGHO2_01_FULL_44_29]|uniref:HTH crp-type domain-containing protein n=1 Tax=Candidatus Daviesbacteria bacterium RIFCSPHIGHO2_02_FULL_43_12 TaxID=1797776 RepID=A0A1F5KGX9_9BACT|nr:MAG: hypothetical protein A2631_04950 [Candidatus Daviesbacteria bacterium RIFCSPHIGHO2_01_FULL_44_29]OGE40070.1 MAG: hypothetical protein A3D25_04680 [Candidatus Daviesbacteria bacterium RIFCSPHIGHO2_02_FULL_43_12]OGE41448.1 MAG: hypothetical protein A3E86_05130 [Candidatus Daviesbacteria bacterium RIFCSPHIGHO2_12_FULL_47_45]OGE70250.1 MAG: hypothetical protein A3B55_00890 [Candidatus Daviesbacteria bacterium RIFCSPLOWO2_01_FULL_43_15]
MQEGALMETFYGGFKLIHYKKGEVILHAGDIPRGVFSLVKGYVRQYSISPEGEEFTSIIFMPGDFFPSIWAVHGSEFLYYLETLTPVELRCVPRDEFLSSIKSHHEMCFNLSSKILVRMGGLMTRMEHLVFGNAADKVTSILILCAERFGQKSGQGVELPMVLSHKQIASLVGVSRETASVEIKNLEREGFVGYKKRRIVIKNIEELKSHSLLR